MKSRLAVISLLLIVAGYLGALIWIDSRDQVFDQLPRLLTALPALLGLSLLSYLARYLRWYWLLVRAGNRTNWSYGLLAYWAGFAFTATPGKAGELLRIRYLTPQGVPPQKVLSAFIYERAFDLVAVLLLSALVISRRDILALALSFVAIFLTGLLFFVANPGWLSWIAAFFNSYRLKKLARICVTLSEGLSGCLVWATPLDIAVSMALGILSWGTTSLSFVWLLNHLGVSISTLSALPIYPLSMLAGAASMLPGGVGSTEGTIIALLSFYDVALSTAMLAAIEIRFSSLWFSVLLGLLSVGVLELNFHILMQRESSTSRSTLRK